MRREEIIDYLKDIESRYPVNSIRYRGITLWPLIRVRLFFAILQAVENHQVISKSDSNTTQRTFWLYAQSMLFFFRSLTITRKSTIFSGFLSHRVTFKQKSFNRFFDPWMDSLEDGGSDSLIFEYQRGLGQRQLYRPDRVINAFELFPLFSLISSKNASVRNGDVVSSIVEDVRRDLLVPLSAKIFIDQTWADVRRMWVHRNLFRFLLLRLKPQKVVLLTYYNPPMMGLILAARQLGIPVSELQHGPQGATHASYSSWTNVPQGGYELLPDEFLCWNQRDADVINAWATSRPDIRHRAVNFGNPWVKYWKGSPEGSGFTSWPEKMILYTTQPVDGVIEPFLADAIRRTRGQYQWWIRLHPRQLGELNNIKQQLQAAGVLDDVNISDATSLPLPEILLHTTLHITRYSGCLLEALEFQVPSIVIDTRGVTVFRDYMDTPLVKADLSNNADNLLSLANEMIR